MTGRKTTPDGWRQARLGDLAEINPILPYDVDPATDVSFVPMSEASYKPRLLTNLTRKYHEVSKGFTSFMNNDVLVAKITPSFENGKGGLAQDLENGVGFGSTEFHVLRPLRETHPKYLYYLTMMEVFRSRGANSMQGSAGQQRVPSDFISKYRIAVPPFMIQERIAAIIELWDEAIELTERLIEALKKRKKGLMQRLLTGELRFPGFEGSKWPIIPLGRLLQRVSRIEEVDAKQIYRLIGVRWYVNGVHIHQSLPGNLIKTPKLSRFEEGDIVYNKMWASKAAFGIAAKQHAGAYGTSDYPQFAPKNDLLNEAYLVCWFSDPRFQYDARRRCLGTTGRARLHPDDFLDISIHLPSLAEQNKIADFLNAIDAQISMNSRHAYLLVQQKKGLMQRLLTGQVRVRVD